jgi:phosphatidylglycerophosphate synthase
MLDRHLLPIFASAHRAVARVLHERRVSADMVTVVGWLVGMSAVPLIVIGQTEGALVAILANRFLDGVDGALARLGTPTVRGAFLDIALDFVFYASIPLAFAWAAPAENALPAAALLAGFVGTGTSFLAYAAARPGAVNPDYPSKGLYYLGGLTEGAETILAFALMCLWPERFAPIAWAFAAACAITTVTRIAVGARSLGSNEPGAR